MRALAGHAATLVMVAAGCDHECFQGSVGPFDHCPNIAIQITTSRMVGIADDTIADGQSSAISGSQIPYIVEGGTLQLDLWNDVEATIPLDSPFEVSIPEPVIGSVQFSLADQTASSITLRSLDDGFDVLEITNPEYDQYYGFLGYSLDSAAIDRIDVIPVDGSLDPRPFPRAQQVSFGLALYSGPDWRDETYRLIDDNLTLQIVGSSQVIREAWDTYTLIDPPVGTLAANVTAGGVTVPVEIVIVN